ncbi:MAG: 1-acyl-sn-glycerol-3-phosphate acyltransferase, partial [Elusimicrobia bacterium]|nr:1-acyl-sn-glycerol-3-phosphate acyltransferase [Elusimicrobiota bacterium]
MSTDPSSPSLIYRSVKFIVRTALKLVWRLTVEGSENVPTQGGVIVAPNHRSYADPPIVGCALQREVHFLAKKELFSFRPFGWLIENLNAHPLNRAGDVGAFRAAARILKAGGVLIMFPEGKRMKTDALGEPKAGIGMLANAAGAPVVPAYVQNSSHMLSLRRLRIRFGAPLYPRDFESYDALARAVMDRISALKADADG